MVEYFRQERREKMNKMIRCKECVSLPASSFTGEWFRRIEGNARRDMLCDWCGAKILRGDRCFADSIGLNEEGVLYYQWETEYIHSL